MNAILVVLTTLFLAGCSESVYFFIPDPSTVGYIGAPWHFPKFQGNETMDPPKIDAVAYVPIPPPPPPPPPAPIKPAEKLYTGYVDTGRPLPGGNWEIKRSTIIVVALNEREALAEAERIAYRKFPQSQGWRDHVVDLTEVPKDKLEKVR